jgi:hypothetical protein
VRRSFSLVEILVWLLQAHKQVWIERLAALFPEPIKFESRRRLVLILGIAYSCMLLFGRKIKNMGLQKYIAVAS